MFLRFRLTITQVAALLARLNAERMLFLTPA